jgi:hypothetical protein
MRLVVENDNAGKATWRLFSSSDMMAWVSESFASTYNGNRAAEAVQEGGIVR